MNSANGHMTVLLKEAVSWLITDRMGFYVDGTFGCGGHSRLVLAGLSAGGRLLAVDKDAQAVAVGRSQFLHNDNFDIVQSSFAELKTVLAERGQWGKVTGLLLDLGVSSPQLDQAERGFSFSRNGPLDMRMNNQAGMTAAAWVNSAAEQDIARVLKEYGEERFARRMAKAIVTARQAKPIETTERLANIITEANPAWEKGKHPATRAFQAIRIYINNELQDLDDALIQSLDMLSVGGRLVVISFHSLEDRRVKRFMQRYERGDELPLGVPVTADKLNKRLRRLTKALKPDQQELDNNPRARSAVMRVAEKIA